MHAVVGPSPGARRHKEEGMSSSQWVKGGLAEKCLSWLGGYKTTQRETRSLTQASVPQDTVCPWGLMNRRAVTVLACPRAVEPC